MIILHDLIQTYGEMISIIFIVLSSIFHTVAIKNLNDRVTNLRKQININDQGVICE